MEEGFRIRVVFVWACGRKGRALAGEWDHLSTRCGFAGQHFNESRNRGWGKEDEGGELRIGEPGGVEGMSQHFHIWRDKQTIQGQCPNSV